MEQLLLSCKGLTPSTLCRFIPALSVRPYFLQFDPPFGALIRTSFPLLVCQVCQVAYKQEKGLTLWVNL